MGCCMQRQRIWNLEFGIWITESGSPARRVAGALPIQNLKSKFQNKSGFTLLEIIIVITILSVLTAAAIPMVRNSVKRDRETEFRLALRQLRQAIDAYKKFNDDTGGTGIPIEYKTPTGYPKDLKILV